MFLAASSPVWLGVGMFMFTIGEMLIVPAEHKLISRFSPQAYRGTYFGVHSLGEIGNSVGTWTGSRRSWCRQVSSSRPPTQLDPIPRAG